MITDINAAHLLDGYKTGHRPQYPDGTEAVYSNLTARKSRIPGVEEVSYMGLTFFIKEYLIERFNESFFSKPKEEVLAAYNRRMDNYLGPNAVDASHIGELHDLGYLPIRIKSLPEGSKVSIGVPMFTIINTIPAFFWLPNYLETVISNVMWKPITSLTTARLYRERFKKHADKVGYGPEVIQWQGHDFSMRGMAGLEDALLSASAHLIAFTGTDCVPAIDFLEMYYNADSDKELVGGSVPACYDNQTEVLTNKGWKLFNDLDKSELVAQYTEEGEIEFVKPLDYFKDRFKGDLIRFSKNSGHKYIDAVVTPNHKMVRQNDGKITLFEAGDFSYKNRKGYSYKNKIVVSGKIKDGEGISDLDRLKIAFQADGSYPSHAEDYTGEKGKGFPIRFSLKKERKKIRLVEILDRLGLEYSLSKYENGYYSFWINTPEYFVKDFSWVDLNNMSYQGCVDFINELKYWDGKESNNCVVYSSTNKDCVDIVQAIASISTHKTQYYEYIDDRDDYKREPLHNVTIQMNKTVVGGENVIRTKEYYDDYVYCVSVPSKMIVTRRNGVVIVCGNTEHSVMCMGQKESEIETFRRLISKIYPKNFISIVSDTWDYWKVLTVYVPALKNEILAREGRVVIRPDSGDPVKIVCGDPNATEEHVRKGSYEVLWDTFGGTINENGYKVLHPNIGLIYGDSITLERQDQILNQLEEKGFSASNLVLGIGLI